MRLLHVAPSFYPAVSFGGPIWTTYALCNALSARPDVEVRVLTTDTAGEKRSERLPVSDFPTTVPAGYEVHYTRCIAGRDVAPGLLARLPHMLAWADVVLLTGTYSFPTIPTLLACRILDKPIAWSPHGALQASHEWPDARRPVLKRAFETVCRRVKPRRCVLHVTAEVEKRSSCARLPEFEAAIIPNAVDFPDELPNRTWLPGGALRLMFISRIDPKKGLDTLLSALPSLNAQTTLDIYGTGEAGYIRALQELASRLGVTDRIRFHGHVDGEAKRNAFLNADLFVLPTHSENFGMVVAEALAHGVPAVVTQGAPWKELDERGCGRWVENSIGALAAAIEELRLAGLADMGAKGRRWMQADFSWEARAADMKALFCRLTADRPSSLPSPAAAP